jgi:hypothetical protein
MKLYNSHRQVRADKITSVQNSLDGQSIIISLKNENQRCLPAEWAKRHNPEPGGYFVEYLDGYKSFCPAEAFERDHTLASEAPGELAAYARPLADPEADNPGIGPSIIKPGGFHPSEPAHDVRLRVELLHLARGMCENPKPREVIAIAKALAAYARGDTAPD